MKDNLLHQLMGIITQYMVKEKLGNRNVNSVSEIGYYQGCTELPKNADVSSIDFICYHCTT